MPYMVHICRPNAAMEHKPWQVPDYRQTVSYKVSEQPDGCFVADNYSCSYADLNKNIHINICADEKECEILYCEKKNPAVKYLIEKKYQ